MKSYDQICMKHHAIYLTKKEWHDNTKLEIKLERQIW